MISICISLHNSLWPAGTFSAFHRIYKTSFRVPFPYRLTLWPPAHLALITLCGRDNYTLGKRGIGPPGTCLRERCSVPCDQSSEGLTSAPVYFGVEALGWYKVRAPCQAGPWMTGALENTSGKCGFSPAAPGSQSHIPHFDKVALTWGTTVYTALHAAEQS